ncbi:hypothetical protein [Variovorax sp. EBFNA2]|uniref:hypothetical protein n=1 Tax=Variovorax sp. EBFNA2 TaxID=3342097 RepID=UPI0029BFE5D8|nr:hypothetical protein [Variovorax boronicumulans]WPG41259.1 hypothetical protein RZE79_30550 [Variovorax boronicumulans]
MHQIGAIAIFSAALKATVQARRVTLLGFARKSIMSQLAVQEAIATLTGDGRDVGVEAVAVTLYNGIVLKGIFKYAAEQRTACVTGSSTALGDANTHVSTFFDLEDVVSFTYAEKNQRIEY